MISLQIKIIFEPAGIAEGETCCRCGKEIEGDKYQGILQFGPIERLSLKELKLFICEDCRTKTSR